jgi:hypothetical protein
MKAPADVVFLLDVDHTLLDNDRVIAETECHLERIGVLLDHDLANFLSRSTSVQRVRPRVPSRCFLND